MATSASDGGMVVINEDIMENGFTTDNDAVTGVLRYYCKQCDFKTLTQKEVKIHLGTIHKSQAIKRVSSQVQEPSKEKKNKKDDEKSDDGVEEEEMEFDEVIKSTQVSDNMVADVIVKFYEDMNNLEVENPDIETKNSSGDLEIPDHTIDDLMRQVNDEGEVKDDNDIQEEKSYDSGDTIREKDDPDIELLIVKSKLNEAREKIALMEIKAKENETKLTKANEEISELKEKNEQLLNDITTKDELNEILIQEKNTKETEITMLDQKVMKYKDTMEKVFKDRNSLKSLVDKQKNTICLLQNQKNDDTNDKTSQESIKKLNEKIKLKNKEIQEIKDSRNRLGKELAIVQNRLKDSETDLKRTVGELQKKINESIKNKVELVEKNKNLEIKNKEIQEIKDSRNRLGKELAKLQNRFKDSKTDLKINVGELLGKELAILPENQKNNSRTSCKYNGGGYCRQSKNCRNLHDNYQNFRAAFQEQSGISLQKFKNLKLLDEMITFINADMNEDEDIKEDEMNIFINEDMNDNSKPWMSI